MKIAESSENAKKLYCTTHIQREFLDYATSWVSAFPEAF